MMAREEYGKERRGSRSILLYKMLDMGMGSWNVIGPPVFTDDVTADQP